MEHNHIMHAFAFLVIAILLGGVFYTLNDRNETQNTISVTGNAETKVMPDEAELSLSVITEGKDAAQVQDDNAKVMNKVIDALKGAGLDDKQIQTTNYYLYPWEEYNYQTGKHTKLGYKLTQTISVKVKDISKVGELLNLAVQNGVTNVDNLNFKLSDKLEKDTKDALVAEATKNAKEKAQTLAQNLDVEVGDPISISETNYYVPRYYALASKDMAMAVEEASVPQISPQEINVQLGIAVNFEIE